MEPTAPKTSDARKAISLRLKSIFGDVGFRPLRSRFVRVGPEVVQAIWLDSSGFGPRFYVTVSSWIVHLGFELDRDIRTPWAAPIQMRANYFLEHEQSLIFMNFDRQPDTTFQFAFLDEVLRAHVLPYIEETSTLAGVVGWFALEKTPEMVIYEPAKSALRAHARSIGLTVRDDR